MFKNKKRGEASPLKPWRFSPRSSYDTSDSTQWKPLPTSSFQTVRTKLSFLLSSWLWLVTAAGGRTQRKWTGIWFLPESDPRKQFQVNENNNWNWQTNLSIFLKGDMRLFYNIQIRKVFSLMKKHNLLQKREFVSSKSVTRHIIGWENLRQINPERITVQNRELFKKSSKH